MAFAEPTEKKARLNTAVLGEDVSSKFQTNQQNSDVEVDLRSFIEFNSAKTVVPKAVLADEYTRDFQTGFSLEFACNYPRLFLLIEPLHLIFSVQVYAAEIRDRTQTSQLIRYALSEQQN